MNNDSTTTHTAVATTHTQDPHLAELEQKESVFTKIFNTNLGDHHGLYVFDYHVADLPYIFYDKETGLQIYTSEHSLEAAGAYELHHGHPIVKARYETQLHTGKTSKEALKVAKPALDLSVTNLVAYQWFGILLLSLGFFLAARKYKRNPMKPPSGLQNLLEVLIQFVRDDIVRPNMPSVKIADGLTGYFVALFSFILILNILGLLPGGHPAAGAVGTTAALAITAFLVINITAFRVAGVKAWFSHLLGGAPWWLAPIMVPIEIVGLFSKPFALMVRLFANMSAGHIVIFSLVGLIFFFETLLVAPVSVGFVVFIYFLETLVALLQAFIFTILTAVFAGLAIGDHGHDDHAAAH
ncbi:hypothetical protein MASR2M18_07560 [Ignavibacteria bacterium]|nr:F0F1 ATP synthase subunit A [Bacteroidota bacterium]MCZ2132726.1 F0F1 ATP synthase subunit A [Bacteroidota bacterium]